MQNTTLLWALRNGVQALVAAGVAWAIAKTGVVIDDSTKLTDYLTVLVWGALMMVLPPLVDKLSKLPVIGPWVALLNGPRRELTYTKTGTGTSQG